MVRPLECGVAEWSRDSGLPVTGGRVLDVDLPLLVLSRSADFRPLLLLLLPLLPLLVERLRVGNEVTERPLDFDLPLRPLSVEDDGAATERLLDLPVRPPSAEEDGVDAAARLLDLPVRAPSAEEDGVAVAERLIDLPVRPPSAEEDEAVASSPPMGGLDLPLLALLSLDDAEDEDAVLPLALLLFPDDTAKLLGSGGRVRGRGGARVAAVGVRPVGGLCKVAVVEEVMAVVADEDTVEDVVTVAADETIVAADEAPGAGCDDGALCPSAASGAGPSRSLFPRGGMRGMPDKACPSMGSRIHIVEVPQSALAAGEEGPDLVALGEAPPSRRLERKMSRPNSVSCRASCVGKLNTSPFGLGLAMMMPGLKGSFRS